MLDDILATHGIPPVLLGPIVLMVVTYVVGTWSPVWLPMVVALRKGPALPRRWALVPFVAAIVNGCFWFAFFAIVVPIFGFVEWAVPSLKVAGHMQDSTFLAIADFFAHWWWVLVPFASIALTIAVLWYCVPRWGRFVEALR